MKEKIVDVVLTEAEQYLGMCMTYSLFEFLKEKFEELIEEQPEEPVICVEEKEKLLDDVVNKFKVNEIFVGTSKCIVSSKMECVLSLELFCAFLHIPSVLTGFYINLVIFSHW